MATNLPTREHFSVYANVRHEVFDWRYVSRISGYITWRFKEEEEKEEGEEEEGEDDRTLETTCEIREDFSSTVREVEEDVVPEEGGDDKVAG